MSHVEEVRQIEQSFLQLVALANQHKEDHHHPYLRKACQLITEKAAQTAMLLAQASAHTCPQSQDPTLFGPPEGVLTGVCGELDESLLCYRQSAEEDGA